MPPDLYEQSLENHTMLAALNHRMLRDGLIVDGHAEGLLAMVAVWQDSTRPQLDVAGLLFAA